MVTFVKRYLLPLAAIMILITTLGGTPDGETFAQPGRPNGLLCRLPPHMASSRRMAPAPSDHEPDTVQPADPELSDAWSPLVTLQFSADRSYLAPIHAIVLPNGKVMLIGYKKSDPHGDERIDATAVISPSIPITNTQDFVNLLLADLNDPMTEWLHCAGHVVLQDGRLFAAGGTYDKLDEYGVEVGGGIDYAQVFDSSALRWTRLADTMLGGKRWYPTATQLPSQTPGEPGPVLVTGGYSEIIPEFIGNRSVELFDQMRLNQGQNPWQMLSPLSSSPRGILSPDYTHVFVLPDPIVRNRYMRQEVMVGGSQQVYLFNHMDSFSNPAARWVAQAVRPGFLGPNLAQGVSSVMLPIRYPVPPGQYPNGSFVMVGGTISDTLLQRADFYNPVANTFYRSVNTGIERKWPDAVLLPDGNILIVNGDNLRGGDPRTPQLLEPVSGAYWTGTPWPEPDIRGYHNVTTLLPDGRVLIAGGRDNTGGLDSERPDLRYYSPPYLSEPNRRPRITSLPADTSLHYGQSYTIGFGNGPIDHVEIIALPSQTHSFDMNQRFVQLSRVSVTADTITVSAPANASVAPPGYYMLFVVRKVSTNPWWARMIPSEAVIIQVGS